VDPALAAWLQQTVSLELFTGEDRASKPTYGSATSYSCRYVVKQRRVTDTKGEERVSTSNALLDGDVTLDLAGRDRFTLPDGTTAHPIRVEKHPDETGTISHTRAFF
jgi:hypothetical protein